MKYVALLRGVNVGGKSRIDMRELKAVFEAAGMTTVSTYINSGNVIFSAGAEPVDTRRLNRKLEKAIHERFGLEVPLLVLSADDVRTIVEILPADWANDSDTKCDVFFLWPDVDDPSLLDRLAYDADMEDVRYAPRAVIRRIDRANAAKSKLTRIVGTPLYRQMTVRNCNTARALLRLLSDEDC